MDRRAKGEGQAERLRKELLKCAGRSAKIVVHPYDRAAASLDADYRRASVVLMPSRSEGFGLVGLEAIVAGVPALISSESGLAELLKEALAPDDWRRVVVTVRDDEGADRRSWS